MKAAAIQAIERVRSIMLDRAQSEEPQELSQLTHAMLRAVELAGTDALAPLWAASRQAPDDHLGRRALSFVIARHATDLDHDRWLPLLDLLSGPRTGDRSTIRNCLTTLQRHAGVSGRSLRILSREIGPFLLYTLGEGSEFVEQLTDAVFALADAGSIEHVLTSRLALDLKEKLRTQAASCEPPVKDAALAAASELTGRKFSEEYPSVLEDLRVYLAEHEVPAPADAWSTVLHWTAEATREFLRQSSAFEELTEEAAARNAPAHELRVTGGSASVGKLPIDFVEKLLHAWRQLYSDVRKTLAGDMEVPGLFVLAPSRGSFVVKVLVEASTTELELETRTADAIALAIRAMPESASAVGDTVAREYATLFRLAAEQKVDLEVGMAVPGPTRVRHRIRFGRVRGRAVIAKLATPAAEGGGRTEILMGVLDGANHRTGRFEMHPTDGGEPVAGLVAKGGRGILLDKVIGETYEFELRHLPEKPTSEPRWELIRLSTPGGGPVTTTRTTREVLAPLPKQLTSSNLPQADSLERITQVVEVVASGKVLSPTTIDLDQRHIDYHKQAARVLHLLADDGTLLVAGATLVTLPQDRRMAHLAIQFEVSVCGRAWLKWARAKRLAELDPHSAEDFLREKSALDKESMIKRRGRTLRRWATDLGPYSAPPGGEDD